VLNRETKVQGLWSQCGIQTGNSEVMQMLQTAAFARAPARTRFAQ
jgi:hypothetical protein